ncbi:MAG: phosphoribosylformimino-5-aminoimidazole carboxamide ribotide isomerase [Gemmatimonadetes bacterium]|nr:phosphoribosylformimino-5-aminoimidazole carboxamide ribotide isomerase [Gemmatimonadota bacterium]MDE3257592.1 phosphoribosylformimino-5-aminoimidazole carboxamide ribotide isomerase [Gemmatimonadota bacterium]
MRFRPCIDLRGGRVVQIVGGSLHGAAAPETNFETDRAAADYARMYMADNLPGGHVIMLGPGNESAALSALSAFPGGLRVGGGIRPENARRFLNAGASHVIVTSYVFRDGRVDTDRLDRMVRIVGRDRLVLDLSCRRRGGAYLVVTELWQRFTGVEVDGPTLNWLSDFCDGFLVHGVDVEGKQTGIEDSLVELLGAESPIDVTYAGGARRLEDLDRVETLGRGRVGLTIGSALDIFGGDVPYADVVAWQRRRERPA